MYLPFLGQVKSDGRQEVTLNKNYTTGKHVDFKNIDSISVSDLIYAPIFKPLLLAIMER